MNIIERARALRAQIENNATVMPDDEALRFVELFPNWSGESVSYTLNTRVRYGGVLYRALQDHVSQETWNPVDAASLWTKVLIEDSNVIPEWEQSDSTNGYMTGDKVTYNGKVYVSLIGNNVWSPEAYPAGWEEVV